MTALVRYEAARAALAEARTIDEVKDIRDKAEALRAYGRMANDVQLEIDATEIRLRAERRLGQLLAVMPKHRGGKPKQTGSDGEPVTEPPTLSELGIDKKLSARSQRIGGVAEQAFDLMVENMRRRMGTDRVRVSLDLLKDQDKKARRDERERVLGEKQAALPQQKFGVIVADPEWRFEPWSRKTGLDRAADNHYPTSCTEVIAARDVASIAADDCVLFLWATAPMLPHALVVMAAWGFDYVSNYVWDKVKVGTGYWNRNVHEHLLIGTRGNLPAPAMGTQWNSIIEAKATKHSAKPDEFLEMIEQYFPTLPKIELNRRGPARKGWAAWGNEAQPGEYDETTGELTNEAPSEVTSDRGVERPPAAEVVTQKPVLPESNLENDELLEIPAFLRRPQLDSVVSPRSPVLVDAGREN